MSYTGNNPRVITQQFRPQSADPANPFEGMIFRADGTSRATGLWEYKSGSWQPLGGAAGGLDIMFQLFGNENLSTWASGNNASFLGGGALAGTFAYNTATPLNGDRSYQYTQAAGSLNDYIASPIQSVPLKFRGNQATFYFDYTYDGGSSDIEAVVYDVTNAALISIPAQSLVPVSSVNGSLYKMNVLIPSTCTQIRVGFQVKVLNSGRILRFDDVVLSDDTTKYADASTLTDWQDYTPTFTGFGTPTNVQFQWRRNGSSVDIRGKFTSGTSTAVEARITLPNNYTSANTTFIPSIQLIGYAQRNVATTTQYGVLIEPNVSYLTFSAQSGGTLGITKQTANNLVSSGEIFGFSASVPIAGLTASNPQIITASESFSTDTAQLVYAPSTTFTLATLSNAPVGTFITFTYAASTNTRTQTTTAPTQSTSDMNTNGIRLFTRAGNASSTAANPAAIAIQIGKGLKGKSLELYKSTGKVTSGSLDYSALSANEEMGATFSDYNENTGILYLDAAFNRATSFSAARYFNFSDISTQTDGYVVINASKSPALVGVPQVLPRIATLSDVKAASTGAGNSTAATFVTRTLNTLSDPQNVGVTLSSNQFTLQPGTYYIEAKAPGYEVARHKLRLRNITDSTNALLGESAYAQAPAMTHSFLTGHIVLTAAKTFSLQHYTQLGVTNGLGLPADSGDQEVYAVVKITKVQ